jgi:tetratricopeptide (TPR) repeat protein
MHRAETGPLPPSKPPKTDRQYSDLVPPIGWRGLGLTAMLVVSATATLAVPPERPRETVIKLVAQIQKADYQGDRATLQHLYADLQPFATDEKLASRVLYWRGFALWRRAINGFNESADPKDLEHDLTQAIAEFKESTAKDPAFVDAKVGTISCLGSLIYLALGHADRVQELIAQSSPLVKELRVSSPENPRFVWVLGGILWNIPPDRGGGQDQAIENYKKGLEAARKLKDTSGDALDPSWGEPELLMSLAWSNLNRTAPDLDAADKYAHSALAMVPYWHYVRDILLPQIQSAKAAAKP